MKAVVYECHNSSCPLGSRKEPGRFTGGASQELVTTITGDPYAKFGDGVCPSCGEVAEKAGSDTFEEGDDPNQKLHDEIAARVADPNDDLNKDNAQAALEAMVGSDN